MFICNCCIYETKYKSNYTKHLKTKKHIKLSNRFVTLKNTNDETSTSICNLYRQHDDYFTYSPPTKDNINSLIEGFYFKKLTVSPDTPSLFENHKEKSSELIKKYNNIYKIIFQEIQETLGFPVRPFPS